jgi:hypothetical protein
MTKPIMRELLVFAVDAGWTARSETVITNEMTLTIPWEDLRPGPAGGYFEVVDVDEYGKRLHEPVDLDHPDLLAQDGLTGPCLLASMPQSSLPSPTPSGRRAHVGPHRSRANFLHGSEPLEAYGGALD